MTRSARAAWAIGLLALLALAASARMPLGALEPALDLKWHELVPASPRAQPKSFLAGRPAESGARGILEGETPRAMLPEGRWMSGPRTASAPVPVVEELDGKRVRIGGYVVPLDFDATTVTEFLLVPFVGACIHVPPPPANQIIYVKTERGFDVQGSFDPVYVTGTLKVMWTPTGLADTGYSIRAESVESRPRG
jgi:hypothetical protein